MICLKVSEIIKTEAGKVRCVEIKRHSSDIIADIKTTECLRNLNENCL